MLAKVSPLYEGAHACQSLPLPPYEGGDLEGVKRRLNDPSSTVPPTQRNADTCAARVPSPNSAYGSGCAVANSWVSLSPAVRRRSLRVGLLLSRRDSHFEAREYDRERQRYIESLGIRVLRFTNREVFERLDDLARGIAAFAGGRRGGTP
jgi:hypothetical protein